MVIGGYWCDLMTEYDQQHWEIFFAPGMVDCTMAEAWADDVWKAAYEDDELDDDESMTESCQCDEMEPQVDSGNREAS
jgi:hypothetical protein